MQFIYIYTMQRQDTKEARHDKWTKKKRRRKTISCILKDLRWSQTTRNARSGDDYSQRWRKKILLHARLSISECDHFFFWLSSKFPAAKQTQNMLLSDASWMLPLSEIHYTTILRSLMLLLSHSIAGSLNTMNKSNGLLFAHTNHKMHFTCKNHNNKNIASATFHHSSMEIFYQNWAQPEMFGTAES